MPTSTASVTTDRPGRYAKQLAAHLSRRLTTSWDAEAGHGSVELGDARAELVARDSALDLRIDSPDDATRDRFEDVIGRHLVRFGTKDELVVEWTRDDGTPGTSYRNDTDQVIGDHE